MKRVSKIQKFGGIFCLIHFPTGLINYVMQLTLFPLGQYLIVPKIPSKKKTKKEKAIWRRTHSNKRAQKRWKKIIYLTKVEIRKETENRLKNAK